MNIVITGSAGFIGYHLAKALLNDGYIVIGIDNHNKDYKTELKTKRTEELKLNQNFHFIRKDINNIVPEDLPVKQVDHFIHLATKDYFYEPKEQIDYVSYLNGTVVTSAKAFELANKLETKKFIFFSTASIYGTAKKLTFTEKDIIPNPNSPQGASKLAAEQTVKYLSKLYYTPAIVFRVSTVYGPFMRPHTLMPLLINNILKGEEIPLHVPCTARRDFVYIDDVINATRKVFKKRLTFQTYNIAAGKSHSIKYAAKLIAKELKKDTKNLKFTESPDFMDYTIFRDIDIDISRAKKMLKYKPKTSLEKGITKTISWYQEHPDELKDSIE